MKLKTILIILLVTMCCCMLASCSEVPNNITPTKGDTSRFQYIGYDDVTQNGNGEAADIVQYYVDNETSIVYMVLINRSGNGTWAAGLTPVLKSNGDYVYYNEFIKDRTN